MAKRKFTEKKMGRNKDRGERKLRKDCGVDRGVQ
jgi:hypothetical protein